MKIKTTLAISVILLTAITAVSALSPSDLENELSKLSSNEKSMDISQFITAKPEQIEIPQQTKQRAINEVLQKLEQNEKVDILIWLNKDVKADEFAKNLDNFEIKYIYDALSGLSGTASEETINTILSDERVDYISLDGIVKASLSQSRPLIQANIVESNYNLTGEGIGVCHLDSGINYNHPNLAHAYAGGYDFINNDPDPLDDNGHGTKTAGVIVSNHSLIKGISIGADLVAVKVLDSTGFGTWSGVAAGINWCVSNRNIYNIQVASMSIVSVGTTYTPPTNPGYIEPALQALYNSNIATIAASGNEGSLTELSYPAVSPYATSVGATYDANIGSRTYSICTDSITYEDMMTCYSNRASFLDLVAPGTAIVTTSISGGITGGSGTSMAVPHVTGTIALMKQRANQMTVPQIENVLKTTGVPVYDNATGLTFKRVNAWNAVNAVPFISKTGVLQSNSVITINVSDPMNPGAMYLTLLSLGTSPGVPLPNGLTIPLVPDFLFSFSLGPSQIMVGNIGLLDSNGRATTTIFIPNFPGIQSFTIYSGFISVRPDLSEFLSVSNAVQL